jgi:hypothetical protein
MRRFQQPFRPWRMPDRVEGHFQRFITGRSGCVFLRRANFGDELVEPAFPRLSGKGSCNGGNLQACGQVETATAALEAIPRLRPDILTLDLAITRPDGLEFLKAVKIAHPRLLILVISGLPEDLPGAPQVQAERGEWSRVESPCPGVAGGRMHLLHAERQRRRNRREIQGLSLILKKEHMETPKRLFFAGWM